MSTAELPVVNQVPIPLLPRKRELAVMDQSGDTKTIWSPDNPDEVAAARSTFDKLKAKGYLAFVVEKGGNKGRAISAFDPEAGAIIMSPPLAGG